MIDLRAIRQRWEADGSKRDERGRRLFAASEARAAGWGGLASVASVTGLARSTIGRGLKDLDTPSVSPGRIRREGGGPRSLTETDATLLDDLKRLVEPATLGDPVRPLLWVSKSLDKLASALVAMGHSISPGSAPAASASFSPSSVFRGRSTGSPTRAHTTPIATPSSNTSTPRFLRPRRPASR